MEQRKAVMSECPASPDVLTAAGEICFSFTAPRVLGRNLHNQRVGKGKGKEIDEEPDKNIRSHKNQKS